MPDKRPAFAPEQEVRFAVVMYGGVSLAIYINGVAQELFRLVRATAPAEGKDKELYLADEKLAGSERTYRELGRTLGFSPQSGEGGPVRTRFVVDIISGTSAGGINGVLLAVALACRKSFGTSADLWRKVADIGKLLREKGSEDDIVRNPPRDAESLLSGYRLYIKAREAMDGMKELPAEEGRLPAFVEQLDLAVTTTDLAGLPLPIRLSDRTSILERTHRKVFRFTKGTPDTTGEDHSDFKGLLDLMLGFAARATSSFPFAFEPVLLSDIEGVKRSGDEVRDLRRFFPDHLRRQDTAPPEEKPLLDPRALAFADGGYLDNKPFSYATDALRNRRADVPVKRVLLYIEPRPIIERVRAWPRDGDRPDVIDNLLAATNLPRRETIREDIAAVGARNLAIDRLRDLGLQVERSLDRDDPLAPLRNSPPKDDIEAERLLGPAGPAYAAYRSLRVRTVLDARAALGARLLGADPDDDAALATRASLRTWIESAPPASRAAFLAAQDVAFQRRRQAFLNDRVNDLLRGGERAVRMVAAANLLKIEGVPDLPDERAILDSTREPDLQGKDAVAALAEIRRRADGLRTLKAELNNAVDGIRRADRAPAATELDAVLSGPEQEQYAKIVTTANGLPGDADGYMAAVAAFLKTPLADADRCITAAIADTEGVEAWIRELLLEYDRRFEAIDMLVLPLAYPDLGERNAVDVVRISPDDARSLYPPGAKPDEDPARKLAGIRLGNFGGFLDRGWRDNDLLWGRLDAAEVIIGALVPAGEEQTRLRVQAQAAILREELGEERAAELTATAANADNQLVEAFRNAFKPMPELLPETRDSLTKRGARIGGGVLGDAMDGRGWPSGPVRAAARFGPSIVKAVRTVKSLPGKLKSLPGKLKPHFKLGWPPVRFGGD